MTMPAPKRSSRQALCPCSVMRLQEALASLRRLSHNPCMSKVRKAKRVVTYVRVKLEDHARIKQIAAKRGHPHTIASVAAEMISRGLKEDAELPEVRA